MDFSYAHFLIFLELLSQERRTTYGEKSGYWITGYHIICQLYQEQREIGRHKRTFLFYLEEKMENARMSFIEKYGIEFDESFCSYEEETVTYYFMAEKSIIEDLLSKKYPEATSAEISIEIPFACYEASSASVMVSPTLDCDGSATDYDWSNVALPFADIEELLAIAREPVVLVELNCQLPST